MRDICSMHATIHSTPRPAIAAVVVAAIVGGCQHQRSRLKKARQAMQPATSSETSSESAETSTKKKDEQSTPEPSQSSRARPPASNGHGSPGLLTDRTPDDDCTLAEVSTLEAIAREGERKQSDRARAARLVRALQRVGTSEASPAPPSKRLEEQPRRSVREEIREVALCRIERTKNDVDARARLHRRILRYTYLLRTPVVWNSVVAAPLEMFKVEHSTFANTISVAYAMPRAVDRCQLTYVVRIALDRARRDDLDPEEVERRLTAVFEQTRHESDLLRRFLAPIRPQRDLQFNADSLNDFSTSKAARLYRDLARFRDRLMFVRLHGADSQVRKRFEQLKEKRIQEVYAPYFLRNSDVLKEAKRRIEGNQICY